MNKYFLVFFILTTSLWSQKNNIDVVYKYSGDTIFVNAINRTAKNIDIKFDIIGNNFLSKTGRVKMQLGKSDKDTILVVKLTPIAARKKVAVTNVKYEFSEIQPIITEQIKENKAVARVKNQEQKATDEKLKSIANAETTNSKIKENKKPTIITLTVAENNARIAEQEVLSNMLLSSKTPIIFVKTGCTRCELSEKIIKEKNLNVKVINTTENKKDSETLWYMLHKQYTNLEMVTMPVILKNKKLTHSHNNLTATVEKL